MVASQTFLYTSKSLNTSKKNTSLLSWFNLSFIFRVIECKGPTNTRVYTVAVYFQGKRLAKASGHSIQEAEMNSAKEALEKSQGTMHIQK